MTIRKNKRMFGDKIRCGKCKEIKPKSGFNTNSTRKDGYAGQCKLCERTNPRKKGNAPYSIIKQKEGIYPIKSYTKQFMNSYKHGASKRKLEFSLDIEEFSRLVLKPCHYCGGFSKLENGTPYCGIDRIDSNKGYIVSNCVSCCTTCNRMKLDHSITIFLAHLKKLSKFQGWSK